MTDAGRGQRFKTKEAADAYIAHLKEPPTVVPTSTATGNPPWIYCEDPAVLRADADYDDRQAQLLAERANELREQSNRYTATAITKRDLAKRLEQEPR